MPSFSSARLVVLLLGLGLAACGDRSQPLPDKDLYSASEIAQESARANAFFERYFERLLARSPERLSILGIDSLADKWTRWTEEEWEAEQALKTAALRFLEDSLQFNALNPSTQLNLQLLREQLQQDLAGADFRYHNYPLQQVNGMQLYLPAFLEKYQDIDDTQSAEAYLQRLQDIPLKISDLMRQLEKRAERGILPPPFVFEAVEADCAAFLSGYPLRPVSAVHPLYLDFLQKIEKLEISDSLQQIYLFDAEQALINQFGRAYRALLRYQASLAPRSTEAISWLQFEEGAAAYAWQLEWETTTDLDAAAMHEMGQQEVAHLQGKIKALMMQLGFQGSLLSFFQYLREQGPTRSDSLLAADRARLEDLLKRIQGALPEWFGDYPSLPAWDVEQLFAAYQAAKLPRYELQAWLHAEVLPGRLFQGAWAEQLKNRPKFRKWGKTYWAYLKGWQAYAEQLPYEKQIYEEAEFLLGHLTRALWRACQLVVDTGIHGEGWSQEEAVDYYLANCAADSSTCQRAVERQAVLPGESTAAQMGLLHLQALRQKAQQQLGATFEEAAFHRVVLQNGAVSLTALENLVDEYIAEARDE